MIHFPINFQVGFASVNGHLLFEVLSYAISFRYYLALKKKSSEAMTFDQRLWIIIGAGAGALLGSRFLGYIAYPEFHPKNIFQAFIFWMSAKSILGGLWGGLLGVEVTKKMMGIKYSTGDLFVHPIILGMMIGRVGCFSQGVFDGTHGIESTLPWAMDMGDGVRRHPVQLYEIIFLGGLWLYLKRTESKWSDGARFKVFLLSYTGFRFVVEWLKPVFFYSFGLSALQMVCLIGFAYYAKDLLNPRRLLKS